MTDGRNRARNLSKIIIVLGVILGIIIFSIAGYFIRGLVHSNYIVPFTKSEIDNSMVGFFYDNGQDTPYLYRYKVSNNINKVTVNATIYVKGKKASTESVYSYLTQEEDKKGTIGICQSIEKGKSNHSSKR